MDSGPTQESVAKEFPRWHVWTGVSGRKYASLRRSSPPVVVSADDWAGVRAQIAAKMAGRLR